MKNISDIIEDYLKRSLQRTNENDLMIKRSEVADQFQCAPSQINYVISTRFTVERGYEVESKRGGGGYIRIRRIELHDQKAVLLAILSSLGTHLSQTSAEMIVYRLEEEQIITEKEKRWLIAVMDRDVLSVDLPVRDMIRAKMMKVILTNMMYE
ncbi:MAG: CtsR family transcriptional regulator [Bacilli bacterium]